MMPTFDLPSFESLNFITILPMMVAIAGGLLILLTDIFTKNTSRSFYTMACVMFISLDLGILLSFGGDSRGFFNLMLMDGIALMAQGIILVASILFIPLALTSRRFHEYTYPEFYALFLFMIAGFQFMTATDNLILIFVGLETASLALYTLIALHNRRNSFEAAIKYFTMGALAAAFYAFGAMLFYLLTGSVEIAKIGNALVESNFEPGILVFAAVGFFVAALGFKISIVPFHTWTPDVYEGSSAVLAGYMSIVPKIAAFVVALRLFDVFIASEIQWVQHVLYIAVVATMTIPNLMALVQDDVKRMLAFSSISHAGFVLAALLIGTTQAHSALFLYWSLFLFTKLGSFAMLWVSRHKSQRFHTRFDHPYSKFSGMVRIMPVGATLMGLFMLSLAGIPPFAVFWGKMYLMSSAVNEGHVALAITMGLNSAVAAYYYLRLIVYMFLKDPSTNDGTVYMKNASNALKTIIGLSALATMTAFLFVGQLLEIITRYVSFSGY